MVPDISVFGPYTYLVTLIFWGSIALVLLVRANALRRAAKTVLVLYPIGYVWDWYSLQVGVFDIVLRTGIDVLGIPLEEHLFILVIPSLVIGVHETLHGDPTRPDANTGLLGSSRLSGADRDVDTQRASE